MRKVAIPMVRRDATSVALRPTRSPKCPKMREPRGRAINAKPNVANEDSSAAVASALGKKSAGKTATAAVA